MFVNYNIYEKVISERAKELNDNISKFAITNNIFYIDYYILTRISNGYFLEKYTVDSIRSV